MASSSTIRCRQPSLVKTPIILLTPRLTRMPAEPLYTCMTGVVRCHQGFYSCEAIISLVSRRFSTIRPCQNSSQSVSVNAASHTLPPISHTVYRIKTESTISTNVKHQYLGHLREIYVGPNSYLQTTTSKV